MEPEHATGSQIDFLTAANETEAAEVDRLRRDPANGIGRRIPAAEWRKFLPEKPEPVAAYEPADGFLFSPKALEGHYGKPYESGTHGLWPGHPDYRSVFLMWGPGVRSERLPELSILEIYPRLRAVAVDH